MQVHRILQRIKRVLVKQAKRWSFKTKAINKIEQMMFGAKVILNVETKEVKLTTNVERQKYYLGISLC